MSNHFYYDYVQTFVYYFAADAVIYAADVVSSATKRISLIIRITLMAIQYLEFSERSTRSERCGNKPLSVVAVLASSEALTATPPMKRGPGQGV